MAISERISATIAARLQLRNDSLTLLAAQRDLLDQRCGDKGDKACHYGEPED